MRFFDALTNSSGEVHIDTGVKIIIAVVVGALLLGGLFLLYTQAIMPNLNTRINAMMETNGQVQLRAQETKLQKSIDGENWVTIAPATNTADTEVVTVKSITKNNKTVWVVLTKDSAMYSACYTLDGVTWNPILSSRQQLRLAINVKGTCLYLTYPGGMEYTSNDGIHWSMTSTDFY